MGFLRSLQKAVAKEGKDHCREEDRAIEGSLAIGRISFTEKSEDFVIGVVGKIIGHYGQKRI